MLMTMTSYAGINYLSEDRAASLSGGLANGGNPNLIYSNYSGDFSSSAPPSLPYADFSASLNGNANLVEGYDAASSEGNHFGWTNSWSLSARVAQTSSLTAQSLHYSSELHLTEYKNGALLSSADSSQATLSSSFQVSFSVSSPAPFTAVVREGDYDMLFSQGFASLSTASGTTLFYVPTGGNGPGGQTFSGVLQPGEVYTLWVAESGASPTDLSSGNLAVDIVIPEPSAVSLAGLAAAIALFRGRSRSPRG